MKRIQENTKDNIKEVKCYKRRKDKVDVYITMSVDSVGDIDAIKQEFQCEFHMTVRWNEPELIGRTTDDVIDWENFWDPSIYIVDIVSYDMYEKTQTLIPSQPYNGPPDVVQEFHIKGTFKEVTRLSKTSLVQFLCYNGTVKEPCLLLSLFLLLLLLFLLFLLDVVRYLMT